MNGDLRTELEAFLDRHPEHRRGVEVAGVSPATEIFADQLADACEPYVQQVRVRAFGKPQPPFADHQTAGEYLGPRAARLLEGGEETEADEAIDAATKALAELGFRATQIEPWILWGERPSLPRALMRVQDSPNTLPDGTRVPSRPQVCIALSDRLTREEWAAVGRQVSVVFGSDTTSQAMATLAILGKRPTELDVHLYRLRKEHPDMTWAEFARVWRSNPPAGRDPTDWAVGDGAVSDSALRQRWSRLDKKIDLDLKSGTEGD